MSRSDVIDQTLYEVKYQTCEKLKWLIERDLAARTGRQVKSALWHQMEFKIKDQSYLQLREHVQAQVQEPL